MSVEDNMKIVLPRAETIDTFRIVLEDLEMGNETIAARPLRYKKNMDIDEKLYPLFSVIKKRFSPYPEMGDKIKKVLLLYKK